MAAAGGEGARHRGGNGGVLAGGQLQLHLAGRARRTGGEGVLTHLVTNVTLQRSIEQQRQRIPSSDNML